MMRKRPLTWMAGALALAFLAAPGALAANKYVQGLAPNWDQPYNYPDGYDPSGPGVAPGIPPLIWHAWCTPTAASCMMGHWADVRNVAGTGDASADGNQGIANGYGGVAWAAGASWHDYCADATAAAPFSRPWGPGAYPPPGVTDIGWYMNTNNLGDSGLITNPGAAHTGTYVGNCDEGLNNYLSDRASPLAGKALTTYVGAGGNAALAAMVKTEIDANRTVLGHFKWWVNPNPAGPGQGDGTEDSEDDFESSSNPAFANYYFDQTAPKVDDEEWNNEDGEEGLGHTVCIVGYSDDGAGNVTHLIAHDNWPSTFRNVRVLVAGAPWSAITTVPEPATLGVLGLGTLLLAIRRKRRT